MEIERMKFYCRLQVLPQDGFYKFRKIGVQILGILGKCIKFLGLFATAPDHIKSADLLGPNVAVFGWASPEARSADMRFFVLEPVWAVFASP